MITEDKVTELFCIADDFCKFFDAMMEKYTLKSDKKRQYHRKSTMSKAEIMVIMILFHDSGYRCLKHFYIEKVCRHMRHLFPKVVSYNRFVELEKEVAIPLALFIKKVLLGKCTGISFVDSTPLRVCRNQRIHIHKVFKGIAQRGKCSMGWFFGFKLHLICNERGELLNFMITPGDVDDRKRSLCPMVLLVLLYDWLFCGCWWYRDDDCTELWEMTNRLPLFLRQSVKIYYVPMV